MTCFTAEKRKKVKEFVWFVPKAVVRRRQVVVIPIFYHHSPRPRRIEKVDLDENCLKISDIRAIAISLVFISLFRNGGNSRRSHFENEG